MKKSLIGLILLCSSLLASSINIALASNVVYAMDDLKKEFNKKHPNINVKVILGSSGKLTTQINHGAPYHIFISANMKYPQNLYDAKIAITKPLVYAEGTLSFLSSKKQDFSKGMLVLKNKDIKRIAIANPKTAPYGIATKQALQNSHIYKDIKSKLVYGESISQTLSFTLSATDIGIVASSLLHSKRMYKYKKGINYDDVDASLYTPIKQGIVMLRYAKGNDDAKLFYKFMLSDDAKSIFLRYGYKVL